MSASCRVEPGTEASHLLLISRTSHLQPPALLTVLSNESKQRERLRSINSPHRSTCRPQSAECIRSSLSSVELQPR